MTIPTDAGFVVLTDNIAISSLQMNGGAIFTEGSTCLPGWTPAPGGTSSAFGSNKCYRMFDYASSWTAAQSACTAVSTEGVSGPYRGGSLRGGLVTIQGLEENNWVARMCRGNSQGGDCWIGMTRGYRGGIGVEAGDDFEWAELGKTVGGSRYRSWATREPSDFKGDEKVRTVDIKTKSIYTPLKIRCLNPKGMKRGRQKRRCIFRDDTHHQFMADALEAAV